MFILIVLLSVLCLATASQKAPAPWSDMCCYSISAKWTETMADGTTTSGIGQLATFNPSIGKVPAPNKLQTSAVMYRSWRREYTQINFVVDTTRPSLTSADATILSKDFGLFGMY